MQDSGIYALDKARILAGETPHATQYGTACGLTGSLRVNTCNYMAPDGSLYLTTRNGATDLCIGYQLVSFAQNETVLDNTASGTVSYTNLDGGTYTFCLRVFDPGDHTAVGQTLRVTIVKEKKLTEQPLFWAAGIAALVLLSVGTAH